VHVELSDVSKGRRGIALPPLSLAYGNGLARLAIAETEQRPTVLGLIAAGRMTPDTGTVRIDGVPDRAALRRRVALVDAPEVSDPAPNVTVWGIVAEELMFAGRPASPREVKRWLVAHDAAALSRLPIADVAPSDRLRLLMELAILRPGVEGLVLVSPDRHGGHPERWWQIARGFAARGTSVLVIAGAASGAVLAEIAPRAELGPREERPAREDAPVLESADPAPGEDPGTARLDDAEEDRS